MGNIFSFIGTGIDQRSIVHTNRHTMDVNTVRVVYLFPFSDISQIGDYSQSNAEFLNLLFESKTCIPAMTFG